MAKTRKWLEKLADWLAAEPDVQLAEREAVKKWLKRLKKRQKRFERILDRTEAAAQRQTLQDKIALIKAQRLQAQQQLKNLLAQKSEI